MAVTKYESEKITSGAGAEERVDLVTQDGNQVRSLLGIRCSDTTAGNKTRVYYNSKKIAEIDNSVFSTVTHFLDLNIDVPINLEVQFGFLNATSGSLDAEITYKYSTPIV